MAIEFVAEDGTGKTDATSYGSVEGFRQYWVNRGTDYSSAVVSDAEASAYLNRATDYVDSLHPWRGVKASTAQALEFPRSTCYDDTGADRSGVLPEEIAMATFAAAGHLAEGKELWSSASNVRSKRMGPVSVTYGFGGEQPVRIPGVERRVGRLARPLGVMR